MYRQIKAQESPELKMEFNGINNYKSGVSIQDTFLDRILQNN